MNYLVFDIGGTAIKYALMNEEADILEQGENPTPMDSFEIFKENLKKIKDKFESLEGVAISMPGKIDSKSGYAYSGGYLTYLSEKNISKELSELFNLKVSVENDGKCAALAEVWKGSLVDVDDGIVYVIGTGIGGGIINDKKLHKGKNFTSGEFSFIIPNTSIEKNERLGLLAMDLGVNFGLCNPAAKIKNMDESEMNGKKFFELANSGDSDILKILDEYCYRTVLNMQNLQHIFDPEKIAVGGGISNQDILMDYLNKNIEYLNQVMPYKLSSLNVVRAQFRNEANLIGALYNFFDVYK